VSLKQIFCVPCMPACVPISASSSASVYPPARASFQRFRDSGNNQDDDNDDDGPR